jgi:hypothetical protein
MSLKSVPWTGAIQRRVRDKPKRVCVTLPSVGVARLKPKAGARPEIDRGLTDMELRPRLLQRH